MKKMLKVLSLTCPSNSDTFKLEVTHVIPGSDGNITKNWGREHQLIL